jgi:hypothetical protein
MKLLWKFQGKMFGVGDMASGGWNGPGDVWAVFLLFLLVYILIPPLF